MIFDGIIRSPLEEFGNFSPFVPHHLMLEEQNPLLVFRPRDLFDLRVQVIMPAFSALFADSPREAFGDQRPFLRAVFIHEVQNQAVLFFGPWALC